MQTELWFYATAAVSDAWNRQRRILFRIFGMGASDKSGGQRQRVKAASKRERKKYGMQSSHSSSLSSSTVRTTASRGGCRANSVEGGQGGGRGARG